MYGKHFQSTYSGSMVGAGPIVFAVWGYVIANTRSSIVELNPVILGAIFGCPSSEVLHAIETLSSPDEKSRSKENEGRRLVKQGEFAYFVPTYEKYQSIRNEDERREYMRNYMRDYRKNADVKVNSKQGKPPLAHLDSDLDLNLDTKINTGEISDGNAPPRVVVPFQKIVDLYHEILKELPRVEKLTKTRKGYIRQRWLEDLPDLTHWENYFHWVAESPFLMGKSKGSGDRPPFRANLEWITKDANYTKITEENYHRE